MKTSPNNSWAKSWMPRSGAALAFAAIAFGSEADTPKEHFARLVKQGGGLVADASPGDGQFVLSVSGVAMDVKVQNPNQLLEMARIVAQRNLAGFFGEKVTASDEVRSQITTIELDAKQKTKIKEFFASVYRADVNTVLRATPVFDTREVKGELFVGFLLSERLKKAADALRGGEGANAPTVGGQGEPPKMMAGIEALGLAMVVKDDVPTARARALKNALRNAVEQAYGATVQSASQLRNLDPSLLKSRQFTASFGAVQRHVVLSERREGAVYKLKIRATVSRTMPLAKLVQAWQTSGATFYLNPGKDPKNPGQDLLDVFGEFFKGLGFRMSERRADADYEIFLKSKHLSKRHPISGKLLTQLQLTVEIKDPKTGKLVLTQYNDARRAVSDLSDPVRRLQLCAQKACRQLEPVLRKKIGAMVIDMLQNGREIQVAFQGAKNLDGRGYHFIGNLIEWMPGVQQCNKTIHPENREVRYTMRYQGALDLMQSTLSSELVRHFPDNHPHLATMSANRILYKVRVGDGSAANNTPGKPGTKNGRALAKEVLPSVVMLYVYKDGKPIGLGTGFFVQPDLLVSNDHVVREGNGASGKFVGQNKKFDVTALVARDSTHDLALLKVKGLKAPVLKLGDSSKVAVGDKVWSIGNPKGLEGTFAQGNISAVRTIRTREAPQGIKVIQHTAPTSKGSSGGPIINEQGEVVGIHKLGHDGELVHFAAPVEFLKQLIQKLPKNANSP